MTSIDLTGDDDEAGGAREAPKGARRSRASIAADLLRVVSMDLDQPASEEQRATTTLWQRIDARAYRAVTGLLSRLARCTREGRAVAALSLALARDRHPPPAIAQAQLTRVESTL